MQRSRPLRQKRPVPAKGLLGSAGSGAMFRSASEVRTRRSALPLRIATQGRQEFDRAFPSQKARERCLIILTIALLQVMFDETIPAAGPGLVQHERVGVGDGAM